MKPPIHTISIPARVSLWLGVIVLAVAYYQKEVALLVIGVVFVCIGCGLWITFGEKSSLFDRMENALYRTLKYTPFNTFQFFYNLEARIELKRKKYQSVLKTEIAKAEARLQQQPKS